MWVTEQASSSMLGESLAPPEGQLALGRVILEHDLELLTNGSLHLVIHSQLFCGRLATPALIQ